MPAKQKQVVDIDSRAVQVIQGYKQEAQQAKKDRMMQNQENWDCYNLKGDFDHKKKGQSKEFLAKQAAAVEQLQTFLVTGLIDTKDWFSVDGSTGALQSAIFTPEEVKKILQWQLTKCQFNQFVNDSVQSGLLGSLMIAKVHGEYYDKVSYNVKEEKDDKTGKTSKRLFRLKNQYWCLKLDLIRQEDWNPDPTDRKLYDMQDVEMDYHTLVEMVESADPEEGWILDAVKNLSPSENHDQKVKKSRETNQNMTTTARKVVTLTEFYGTVVDSEGKVLYRDVMCVVADGSTIIRRPRKTGFWHGERPYVVSPIQRVAWSVWHKAIMDVATKLNHALNEIYNLMLDAGIMSVFGIRQLRPQYLQNPNQVSDGVGPGTTLVLGPTAPPGEKALERLDTGSLSNEAMAIYNLTDSELKESAKTNDVRLGGLAGGSDVKATAIVASQQSISGMLNGMTKLIEENYIAKILHMAWQVIAQNLHEMDRDELGAILGPDRATEILANSPEDLFASTALGYTYRVYGLSTTLNKIQDFRKLQTVLQTVGTAPVLAQEFTKGYSWRGLLELILKSLDIDVEKIRITESNPQPPQDPNQIAALASGGAAGGQGQPEQAIGAQNTTVETPEGADIPRAALAAGMPNS
jgi:hypothetical protein